MILHVRGLRFDTKIAEHRLILDYRTPDEVSITDEKGDWYIEFTREQVEKLLEGFGPKEAK